MSVSLRSPSQTSPLVGLSSAASMLSSVVLPEPLSPHDGDVLALLYGKGNVGQSLYVMRAKARGIHLFQIVRPKNGHVGNLLEKMYTA